MKHLLLLVLLAVSIEACFAQAPPSSIVSVVYSNITAASLLDGCDSVSPNPCINNQSSFQRQSSYYAFRGVGSGSWTIDMQWAASSAPTTWTSFGSTGQVSQASTSGIGYGIGPPSISKPYYDFIRFVMTGSVTIMNYFGTKQAWWIPSVASISFPISGSNISITSATVWTPPITISASSASSILTLTNSGAGAGLTVTSGATSLQALAIAGAFTGTHAQNLGSGDSPTFNILTVSSCVGCGGVSPPITFSASIAAAGSILTVTNTNSGNAIVASSNGAVAPTFSVVQNGNGVAASIIASGSGNALAVTGPTVLTGTLSASGATSLAALAITGAFTGTHAQNLGSGDNPTFNNVTVTSCMGCGTITPPVTFTQSAASSTLTVVNSGAGAAITVSTGATSLQALAIAGAFTGTHAQNVGSGDSPTFNALTVSSCAGCTSISPPTTFSGTVASPSVILTLTNNSAGSSGGGSLLATSTGTIQPTASIANTAGGQALQVTASGGSGTALGVTGPSIFNGSVNISGGCTGCGTPTPPITFSASIAGTILTITQSGAGAALAVNGNSTLTGNLTVTGTLTATIASPGSNTQVLYNNSGSIAGNGNLTFNGSTLTALFMSTTGITTGSSGLNVNGALTINSSGSINTSGTFGISGVTTATNVVNVHANTNADILDITNANTGSLAVGVEISTTSASVIAFSANTQATIQAFNNSSGPGLTASSSSGSTAASFTGSGGTCSIVPTSTALSCSSDARLKRNFSPIADGLDKVMALDPGRFMWKSDKTNALHAGFLAQEVQPVIPDVVMPGADGYLSMNYIGLVPYLVAAVQEQQRQIDKLKLELANRNVLVMR